MSRELLFAAVAFTVAVPLTARADSRPSLLDDHRGELRVVTLELDLGLYVDESTAAPLVLGTSLRPLEQLELEVDWPLASVLDSDHQDLQSGNPLLAAYFVHRFERGYARVGGGFTLPIAHVDIDTSGSLGEAFRELAPFIGASAASVLWDAWLFLPNRFAVVVPAQAEARVGGIQLGGELTGGYLLSLDAELARDDQLLFQGAGWFGAALDRATLGLRLQLVWLDQSDGRDALQTALGPFVQTAVGEDGFLFSRFLLALDEPLGIARGDGDFAWGLHIGGGVRL